MLEDATLRSGEKGNKRLYIFKYALSSIVFCGEIYRRNRGKKSIFWRCVSRLDEKGSECEAPTILKADLQNAVLKAINQTISEKDEFLCILMNNIATALGENFDKATTSIDYQLEDLQNELIKQANLQENYDALVDEIYRLRETKQDTLEHNAERHTKRQRITETADFLKEQDGGLSEYDDKLVRRLVER